jgi:DeoR/GlpR family transcriptional regulator of sugar metabolism
MEKAQQRGKAKKTHGGKILQNTPKKSVKTHAESHEKRHPTHAAR